MADTLAHVGPNGEPHLLRDHLTAVASGASEFAQALNSSQWAAIAGLWHDLGKYRPGFQRCIRLVNEQNAHIEGKLPTGSGKVIRIIK